MNALLEGLAPAALLMLFALVIYACEHGCRSEPREMVFGDRLGVVPVGLVPTGVSLAAVNGGNDG